MASLGRKTFLASKRGGLFQDPVVGDEADDITELLLFQIVIERGHGKTGNALEEKKVVMAGLIEKVKGGYIVDGLELLAANCVCGGLTGPGGAGIGDCCMTFSRVRQNGTRAPATPWRPSFLMMGCRMG